MARSIMFAAASDAPTPRLVCLYASSRNRCGARPRTREPPPDALRPERGLSSIQAGLASPRAPTLRLPTCLRRLHAHRAVALLRAGVDRVVLIDRTRAGHTQMERRVGQ